MSRQVEDYEIYGRAVKIDCVLSIPSVSLPAGLATDGMPIGIMFYARPGMLLIFVCLAAALHCSCTLTCCHACRR